MQTLIAESSSMPLDAVMLVMPHANSDWKPYLKEAQKSVCDFAKEIIKDTCCILILPPPPPSQTPSQLKTELLADLANHPRMYTIFAPTNDTWARDFAPLSIQTSTETALLKFQFNAWGNKFQYDLDNNLAANLANLKLWKAPLLYSNLVLEGGSIESNGQGCLLTTSACLLHNGRNPTLDKKAMQSRLCQELGVQKVLWLEHGYLNGDDTDCHVDNLARFLDATTIAYVTCHDPRDEHYHELREMEKEIQSFTDCNNKPFNLVPLPMCTPIFYENKRLPASYANFLILQNRILMPFYSGGLARDKQAQEALQAATHKDIIGVDCSVLIRQNGGLHCMSMQFAHNTLNL